MICVATRELSNYQARIDRAAILEEEIEIYAAELLEQYRENEHDRYIITADGKEICNPDLPHIVDEMEEELTCNQWFWKAFQKHDYVEMERIEQQTAQEIATRHINDRLDDD